MKTARTGYKTGIAAPQGEPRPLNPVIQILSILILGLGGSMIVPLMMEASRSGGHPTLFAFPMGVTLAAGTILLVATRSPVPLELDHRQAFLVTALSWLMMPAVSAMPFVFAGLSWTDAVFEAASGLTTTGSTVIHGLDHWPSSLLFWRSFLQWIGGVGIIVTAVALLPFMRVGGMQLFRAESSDHSEKIEARAHVFVVRILVIYLTMTAVCAFLFVLFGMSGFDAVNHAMTTISTGGFSTHDASFAHFTAPALHVVAIVFMIAGAIPFVAYMKFIDGDRTIFVRDPQVVSFLTILAIATVGLGAWHFSHSGDTLPASLLLSGFNVVSVVTTTGFASTDYTQWGNAAIGSFFLLTFLGGCAGSTAGGVKTYRLLIIYRVVKRHLIKIVTPNRVLSRQFYGRRLEEDAWTGVIALVFVFFATFAFFTLALTFTGLDFVTALSGSATAITNVGPGLGDIIGPSGNFASLPDAAKWMLAFEMILGRLEVLTFLVGFLPGFWD